MWMLSDLVDVVVIFGNVFDEIGVLKFVFVVWFDVGVWCYCVGQCLVFLVSGVIDGFGLNEVMVMCDYFVVCGVLVDWIVVDDQGDNMFVIVQYMLVYLCMYCLLCVLIVSQYYYFVWVCFVFECVGIVWLIIFVVYLCCFQWCDVYLSWCEVLVYVVYVVWLWVNFDVWLVLFWLMFYLMSLFL